MQQHSTDRGASRPPPGQKILTRTSSASLSGCYTATPHEASRCQEAPTLLVSGQLPLASSVGFSLPCDPGFSALAETPHKRR